MTVKIRFARGGAKKSPYYRLVIANSTSPRDGKFIEKVGVYNPLLNNDNKDRIVLKIDRIEYWLGQGAQPTERVLKFITAAGISLPIIMKKKYEVLVNSQTRKAPKKSS